MIGSGALYLHNTAILWVGGGTFYFIHRIKLFYSMWKQAVLVFRPFEITVNQIWISWSISGGQVIKTVLMDIYSNYVVYDRFVNGSKCYTSLNFPTKMRESTWAMAVEVPCFVTRWPLNAYSYPLLSSAVLRWVAPPPIYHHIHPVLLGGNTNPVSFKLSCWSWMSPFTIQVWNYHHFSSENVLNVRCLAAIGQS